MASDENVTCGRGSSRGNCPRCDEPIVVHNGPHLVTVGGSPAIVDAIEHAMAHPSCTVREGYEMEYVVEEGYYPGDTIHYVDLSGYPPEHRSGASLDAHVELSRRALMVNSIRWDPPRLHVVAASWLVDRLPGGGSA